MTNVSILSAKKSSHAQDCDIVSMLSLDEKSLYYNVTLAHKGDGEIVEIGPWLGSGTFQICSALEQAGRDWSITVIDRFIWSKIYVDRYSSVALRENDCFVDKFKENLSRFVPKIKILKGELLDIKEIIPLHDRQRIEILFVDAPKSWRMLWTVLEHLGPHLLPGSTLVFQDFFHITSRQIIWLLSSIPQLTLSHLVENGTAAAFTCKEPLRDIGSIVPPSIDALSISELIELWNRIASQIPEHRLGEIAAGMSLDLLERNAFSEATDILIDGVVNKPWASEVLHEVERLARVGNLKSRTDLFAIAAFLKTRIPLQELLARQIVSSTKKLASAPILATFDKARLLGALNEIGDVSSAAAAALCYQATQRVPIEQTRALLSAFDSLAEAGASKWLKESQLEVVGRNIVEFSDGPTMRGLACRVAGASCYTTVNSQQAADQRTIKGEGPGQRVRLKSTLASVADLDGGMRFVSTSETLEEESFDTAIIFCTDERTYRQSLTDALRLLRPGGALRIEWTNPLGWSGHGKAPFSLAEYNPEDANHHARADWRHVPRAARTALRFGQIEAIAAEIGFAVENTVFDFDDLAILTRLTPSIRRTVPALTSHDFAIRNVTVTARKNVSHS